MKLYLISQSDETGYDTYDSAVVAAENEHDAVHTFPDTDSLSPYKYDENREDWYFEGSDYKHYGCYGTWTRNLDAIEVKYLGEAVEGIKAGPICASFNAG